MRNGQKSFTINIIAQFMQNNYKYPVHTILNHSMTIIIINIIINIIIFIIVVVIAVVVVVIIIINIAIEIINKQLLNCICELIVIDRFLSFYVSPLIKSLNKTLLYVK